MAQVSLRWLLQKDVVSSVIFGATSVDQLENNMGAGTGWKLTPEEVLYRSINLKDRSLQKTIFHLIN